jgi:hypothetical protein
MGARAEIHPPACLPIGRCPHPPAPPPVYNHQATRIAIMTQICYKRRVVTPETEQTLTQMARVLDDLNQALQTELTEMERMGLPPAKIEHVRAGAKAIRDCGNMLLIWSDYIARGDLSDPSNRPDSEQDLFPR